MYDKLLFLPFFMGIGSEELQQILGTTRFRFLKLASGKTLLRENDRSELLYFLIDGALSVITTSDDHRYRITEQLAAPAVLQPELLFGVAQYHTRSYVAEAPCSLFALDKNEILRLIGEHLVFRLNFINAVSTIAQRAARQPWMRQSDDIGECFVAFLRNHCMRPAGRKTLEIRMTDLAHEIHASRLNVSRLLNRLQSAGLLTFSRSRIQIPAMEKLFCSDAEH